VDRTVTEKAFHAPAGGRDIFWLNDESIRCYDRIDRDVLNACVYERRYPGHYVISPWGRFEIDRKPLWELECGNGRAVAVCRNAVVVACEDRIIAAGIADGAVMWERPLPAPPVRWGMAVDGEGRVIVSLKDGSILCFGKSG